MLALLHDRIDTHIHFIPPSFASALQAAKTDPYTGYPVPQFSIPELFAALKELDVQTAVLSVTTPGPPIAGSGPEGRELARKCNDEGMELVRQGEGRFKFFGSTPCWTDVQGTIDEIEYCLVTLKCPGIVCLSSYGDR
jgi:6-methylsalicylate decarboxylase